MNRRNASYRKGWSLLPYKVYLLGLSLIAVTASCNGSSKQATAETDSVNSESNRIVDSAALIEHIDSPVDDHTIYYVVVADSSKDYHALDSRMYELNKRLNWPIDTMNRHYDAVKKRIALAEDDDDEMYRGEYYPRRSPSTTLSLEYYGFYSPESTQDNIVLVAGFFDEKASADSMHMLLRPHAPNSFVVRSKVYTGCMH